jgi:4,5-DOPA dioxygenase extradiol
MERKTFIKTLALLPLAGLAAKENIVMNLNDLNKTISGFQTTEKMPVLFVGHGNPMNAITKNQFSDGWAYNVSIRPIRSFEFS